MDRQVKGYGRFNNSGVPSNGDVFEPMSSNTGEKNAKQRATLVEWLNFTLPDINLPINASDEELRKFLIDGTVLCRLLNKLKPGSVTEYYGSDSSPQTRSENVQRFLSAMDTMGLPRFQAADLEKGSMRIVLDCLLTLRTQFMPNFGTFNGVDASSRWKMLGQRIVNINGSQRDEPFRSISSPSFGDNRRTLQSGSTYQHPLRSPGSAPLAAINHHVGHIFHEVFQLKQGSYTDLPDAKISEMMKSNSLDNAPTQSLLSVVNGILDESIERKNGEIPHRVACLLRKVVQEIERRISTQAEHLRTQNNLFKAREEKYQSRIRVLEALATGTSEETQIVMNQLQQIKNEKSKMEEKKKVEKVEVRLKKENEDQNQEIASLNQEIASLKQELEMARRTHEQETMQMKAEAKEAEQEIEKKLKEVVSQLTESRGAEQEIEKKLNEVISQLTESRNRVKELESFSESKSERWSKKEHIYHIFTEFQLGALRELRFASQSIRQEVVRTQKNYSEEFGELGSRISALDDAAKNYYSLLAENRKMHNELQELKGNIRVYCRVRPFLPGQKGKQSIIEYVGENGELVVVNPSKQGKEGRKSFKFNKVYGQAASQAEVFSDTQPLIQSVLDGFNVCIFAYGQTGSGKTYTMTGPDRATEEEWGVNYRALNDLFRISQSRGSTFTYEISVQMVEIYNEQVRDLLSSDGPAKKIGIKSTVQPNGLALPDASIHPVNSTSDVLKLMDTGLKNRAKGSTALNERSSRSHSVVSIHARGTDLKSGSSLRGSLHLVDLAGSERVDRSEVTGDRLKEAQHINKSLSALGDVIFALAQKSTHVPYRNSKLTQVLQSSLGGHAKTLMFVQLNPDSDSFSESVSTLKFAERVSGVELGAAKSSKDGRDVRELMEQVTSLKDTIAKKDEEIERLQIVSNKEKRVINSSTRYGSTSPSKNSTSETPQRSLKLSGGKGSESAASDHDDYSDGSDKHSINSSHQSSDDFRQQKVSLRQTKTVGGNIGRNISDNNLGSRGDPESDERVSGKSDSVVLMGTGTEGSPESSPVPDHEGKSVESTDKTKSPSRLSRSRVTKSARESPMISTGLRKSNSGTNLSAKPSPSRRWQ